MMKKSKTESEQLKSVNPCVECGLLWPVSELFVAILQREQGAIFHVLSCHHTNTLFVSGVPGPRPCNRDILISLRQHFTVLWMTPPLPPFCWFITRMRQSVNFAMTN